MVTLSTSYLTTTQEHRDDLSQNRLDISQNRLDISSNLSKINYIRNNKYVHTCTTYVLNEYTSRRRSEA